MSTDLMTSVFRPEVLKLSAYHVADASGLVKLDAMENPYGWPELLKQEWLDAIKDCPLNRYPDPSAKQLAQTLRQVYRIPDHSALLLGNGSDEIIQLLIMAVSPGSAVLAPHPGFVMYKQLSDCLGLDYLGIPLLPDTFELDLPAMLTAIERHQPAVIFLAYPNNPTGNLFDAEAVKKIIAASSGLVVIDEAYEPFADSSFLPALGHCPNVLVMRTVSKLGLAGLRLGYLVGPHALVDQLDKIRLPYNINSLTQLTADFALTHKSVFDQQSALICEQRSRVFEQLKDMSGITPYASAANFILFKTPPNMAGDVFTKIRQQGVLIKNLSNQGGLLTDCLRVTIGKPEENQLFLNALRNSLEFLL